LRDQGLRNCIRRLTLEWSIFDPMIGIWIFKIKFFKYGFVWIGYK
jgi:hypothetical protein